MYSSVMISEIGVEQHLHVRFTEFLGFAVIKQLGVNLGNKL